MKIAFYGDSLTRGIPGASYFDILSERLPEHALLNYGKGGETALSLYRRIVRRNLLEPVDLAFLWIGTNDVLARLSWAAPVVKGILRQPWARSREAFRLTYRALLDILCSQASKVVTVPPVLIGEDIGNGWNRDLGALSGVIEELSSSYTRVEYLDLRVIFAAELGAKPISDYLPRSALWAVWDALTLMTDAQIDRAASARGLHVTLDGVHLNSTGAALVADAFMRVIEASYHGEGAAVPEQELS